MAKVIFLVLAIFAVALAVNSSPTDNILENAFRECGNEFGISEEDGNKMSKSSNPADIRTMKCLRACAMKKWGVMVDGKINLDKVFSTIKDISESEKPDFKKCAEKAQETSDECEVFDSFKDCMKAARLARTPK